MAETIRSFIAIEVIDQMREEIAKVLQKLKMLPCDVKWVKPENIHLTLHFLGHINLSEVEKVKEGLKKIIPAHKAFSITIDKELGAFPDKNNPRVIWLGVKEGEKELLKLYHAIKLILDKVGIKTEKRIYHPHLTLGRLKSSRNKNILIATLKELKLEKNLSFSVKEVTLFKSNLTPQGPIYQRLAVCSLG